MLTVEEIHNAVLQDDWSSVSELFKVKPELRTMPINVWLDTPLMLAVGINRSNRFASELVSSLRADDDLQDALNATNYKGDTALHHAVKVGNVKGVNLLMMSSSDPDIALRYNEEGQTPLLLAAWLVRNKPMLESMYYKLGVFNDPHTLMSFDKSLICGNLLTPAIDAGFLDLALKLTKRYLRTGPQRWEQRALAILASKTDLFASTTKRGFLTNVIYNLLPVPESKLTPAQTSEGLYDENLHCETEVLVQSQVLIGTRVLEQEPRFL
ncbi:hypothetical protein OSB04_010288 [Centaurea solstitialis]|uniref:Uncharacterized protein n=1 Tax=Centaurea solstitialis TaxID=347529 RepID=A0AA38T7A1_9ASTR|nr:hypothetical protein OSB04_010288 [Centaurea solstitialis]